MNNKKINTVIIGIINFVAVFLTFTLGSKLILDMDLELYNYLSISILSLIVGLVSSIIYMLNLKIFFFTFELGLVIGIIFLLTNYSSNLDGWSALAGVLSFLMFTIAGLVLGLILQLIYYFYKRYKRNK